jgi:phosphatidylserine/phosphatidylglycerophosphate/cardiolipin synthase-like enzyme
MVFSFTDFDIANKLVEKSKKELDVRGVLESKRVNMQYNQYRNLAPYIEITKDTNQYTMHHKVFIIDNQTVITGSYNPTKAGNTKNDENILIIHNKNIAEKYLEEFENLFN